MLCREWRQRFLDVRNQLTMCYVDDARHIAGSKNTSIKRNMYELLGNQ